LYPLAVARQRRAADLQGNPTATPSLIQTVLIERATTQQVLGNLRGSPNRLLFTNF
jgi:hypothetical protein